MTRTLLAAVAFCIALPLSAQETPETRALAETYVNLSQVQKMLDDMLSPDAVTAQFTATLPPNVVIESDKIERISVLVAERLATVRPDMIRVMTDGAAETFTAPELEALIAFYSSETGASVMGKMQGYMASAMQALGPRLQQEMGTLGPEIARIVRN